MGNKDDDQSRSGFSTQKGRQVWTGVSGQKKAGNTHLGCDWFYGEHSRTLAGMKTGNKFRRVYWREYEKTSWVEHFYLLCVMF